MGSPRGLPVGVSAFIGREHERATLAGVVAEARLATLTRSGVGISDDNASAVGEICRHPGGIALAIELAAAQVLLAPLQSHREAPTARTRGRQP